MRDQLFIKDTTAIQYLYFIYLYRSTLLETHDYPYTPCLILERSSLPSSEVKAIEKEKPITLTCIHGA